MMPKGIPAVKKSKSLKNTKPNPTPTAGQTLRKSVMGRPVKYTEEWIKEEAQLLIDWVNKDEGIYLGDFTFERGYGRTRLNEFAQVSKDFSEALDFAKHWQERKMLRGGLLKEMDATQVRYSMARLCGDIWKNSYDREESDKDITLNINVNRIQD